MAHDKVKVFTSAQTNAMALTEEQLQVLGWGPGVEEVSQQVQRDCSATCALGNSACRLLITGDLSISALCRNCPNPIMTKIAVESVLDYADQQLDSSPAKNA